jgi:hypothetical protein
MGINAMRRLLMQAGMLPGRHHWSRVERLAADPDAAQHDVLMRLLEANRNTRFGTKHGFAAIRDVRDFRARVPVQDYETLRPYIDDQRRAGVPALTAEQPIFYAQTSGSTGKPKYVPVTPSMMAMQRSEQRLFSYLQYRACPAAFEGKAFGIMGAAVEDRLETGHAVGSVSGHLYASLPRMVRSRFVVPPEVLAIADYDLKYLVILRLALGMPDITYLGSPNPSTFTRLLVILNEHRDSLLDSLAGGPFEPLDCLDASARAAVQTRLTADAARARQLRRLPLLTYANVWPGIRLVTTWTGGSCGIALDAVRKALPPEAVVMELGYQSTECRGSMALEPEVAAGLPPLDHHFFEFVEQASWDSGNPEFLGLGQLERHKRYYVLFTTAAGLYRYFMNDLIEVDGFLHRTPLLRFIQKGKGVTSLTGEKLYEAQVIEAVRGVSAQLGVPAAFFLLVAEEDRAAYTLFVEPTGSAPMDCHALADAVDRGLSELNLEYQGKRKSGRLGGVTVARLQSGTADAYKAACVRAGQRESQFKPAVLQYRRDLSMAFDDYVLA